LEGLPRRCDIDPAEIKPLLPYLMIVDFIGTPMRVRYRLVGTEIVRFSTMDFTNAYLDELIFGAYDTDPVVEAYRMVAETRLPVVAENMREWSEASALALEFLICPLSEDAARVSQCLVIEDYFISNSFQFEDIPRAIRQ
jgi:hypothetical protein